MTSKYIKTGILTIILVVPVLIFAFIKFFGKNHYELPYFGPKKLSAKGDTIFFKANLHSFKDINDKTVLFSKSSPIVFSNQVDPTIYAGVIQRLKQKTPSLQVFTFGQSNLSSQSTMLKKNTVSKALYDLLGTTNTFYLLDNEGHVRGTYVADDLQEIDNLIIEIELLKQTYLYEQQSP